MQNTTFDNISSSPAWPPVMYDPAILTDPEFLCGFQTGLDAYEGTCEDKGRKMTGMEVLKDMCDELTPSAEMRLRTAYYATRFGPIDPRYIAGFLAGELYAHFLMPDAPATAFPDTQPLAAVLPFRSREQQ